MESSKEYKPVKVNTHGYSPIRNFVAGGFGGSCGVLVTFPLDTLKVRLQAMPSGSAKVGCSIYKGTLDCLMKTVRTEGFLALYRGMGTPLAFATPTHAMNFLIYSFIKRIQATNLKDELTLGQTLKAGMFNGFCMAFIFAPVERIKCILQVQNSIHLGSVVPRFRGPLDCAAQTFRQQRIFGIYRGLWGTVLREIPGGAIWFLTYESVVRAEAKSSCKSRDEADPITVLTAGALAGMAYWSAVLPFDVLKTRYQTASGGTRGVIDVLRRLLKEESPRALYKGFAAILLLAGPQSAAVFGGYETAMRFMKFFDQN